MIIYMLFANREVRIGKNFARGLKYSPRPEARGLHLRPTPEASGGIQDSGHSFSQYGPTRPFSLKLNGILSRRIRMILGCNYGKIFHNLHEQLQVNGG